MSTRWLLASIALALPFVVFALWRRWVKRRGGDPATRPFVALWLIGVTLAVETLLLLAWRDGLRSVRPDPPVIGRSDAP